MQGFDAQGIEVVAAIPQKGVVLPPCRGGIGAVGPGGHQDRLPQGLLGLTGALFREQLFRPGPAGDGGDAPLVAVLHGVAVGLDDGDALHLGLGELAMVDAPQAVGVLGEQVDAAGQLVHVVLEPCQLPVRQGAQGGELLVPHMELAQGLVGPVHHDPGGPGPVGLLHHQLHKLRLIQLGVDEDLLALLDVHAHVDDQCGVISENRLFHSGSSQSVFHYFTTAGLVLQAYAGFFHREGV